MAEIQTERYEDSELYRIRHSAAHIMAQAIMELFEPGEAKIAIGPPVAELPDGEKFCGGCVLALRVATVSLGCYTPPPKTTEKTR